MQLKGVERSWNFMLRMLEAYSLNLKSIFTRVLNGIFLTECSWKEMKKFVCKQEFIFKEKITEQFFWFLLEMHAVHAVKYRIFLYMC